MEPGDGEGHTGEKKLTLVPDMNSVEFASSPVSATNPQAGLLMLFSHAQLSRRLLLMPARLGLARITRLSTSYHTRHPTSTFDRLFTRTFGIYRMLRSYRSECHSLALKSHIARDPKRENRRGLRDVVKAYR
jgi:hypothetical protein